MKKSDLKDGMVCLCRNEEYYIVLGGRLIRHGAYNSINSYENDLTMKDSPTFDIMKVYTCSDMISTIGEVTTPGKLIWKREEMIPGHFYTINFLGNPYTFRYEKTCGDEVHYTLSYTKGIGTKVNDWLHKNNVINFKEATQYEITALYDELLKNGFNYVINAGTYNYIITFSYLGSDGTIYYTKLYDCENEILDNHSNRVLCKVTEVNSIRMATEEELALLNPIQEFTIAELEKKLSLKPGTLRIKK